MSMADIAFLLLFFLLITMTLKRDQGLAIQLPAIDGGERDRPVELAVCNVWISEDETISLLEDGILWPLSTAALVATIRQRLAEEEDLVISLKTEPGVDYDMFISVLDVLKGTGAARISIASQ